MLSTKRNTRPDRHVLEKVRHGRHQERQPRQGRTDVHDELRGTVHGPEPAHDAAADAKDAEELELLWKKKKKMEKKYILFAEKQARKQATGGQVDRRER